MGTWDEGMLDNDSSLDGLGDITHGLIEDIQTLGTTEPGASSTGRLGAAIGILLQLSPFDFSADSGQSESIVEALKAHEQGIGSHLPAAAQKILARVVAGEGQKLAERTAALPATLTSALHTGAASGPFGLREPSLFETESGAAYVEEVAQRCVQLVADDFEDEDNWSDLCREASGMGALATLLVLEPCAVSPEKVLEWRTSAAKGLAQLEAEQDDELDFQRPYYANVDLVFAALLQRYE
ncbi:MAG: hypothetical protein JKY65_04640 [Planctomycetes bacterium]|nr:hypothetical protein [Planctomycetota bacterium]